MHAFNASIDGAAWFLIGACLYSIPPNHDDGIGVSVKERIALIPRVLSHSTSLEEFGIADPETKSSMNEKFVGLPSNIP